jgi:dienelactone hydrolase
MRHPDAYLEQLYDELEIARHEQQQTIPWEERRTQLLNGLKQALGRFELTHRGEDGLDPVLLERVELEEAVRERVEFTTLSGLRMPAYVMIPKSIQPGEKRPAVLLWHGHGYGSRSLVGLDKDGREKPDTGRLSDNLAYALAKRGLIVMAPEIVGFGDRKLARDVRKDPNIDNSCYNLSVSLMMTGRTTAGLRTAEALRAADYLATRPEVAADRIGNMGHSGGGIVASLSAALDPRIQASVVAIYPNTYRGSILAMRHCLCNYISGILTQAEMPDLLALIAPRPLLLEGGIRDPIFPVETTKVAIEAVRGVYESCGASDRFSCNLFDGGHEFGGPVSLDWLAEKLRS